MDSETDLVNSCKNNIFPKISTMSKFGINNKNPIDVINCYITSITEDGLNENDFKNYKNINILFEEKTFFLKQKDFYKRVINSGGIIVSRDDIIECNKCYYNGVENCMCKYDIKI